MEPESGCGLRVERWNLRPSANARVLVTTDVLGRGIDIPKVSGPQKVWGWWYLGLQIWVGLKGEFGVVWFGLVS